MDTSVWLALIGSGGIVITLIGAIIAGIKWTAGRVDQCCQQRDKLVTAEQVRLAAFETERNEELKRFRSQASQSAQTERLP